MMTKLRCVSATFMLCAMALTAAQAHAAESANEAGFVPGTRLTKAVTDPAWAGAQARVSVAAKATLVDGANGPSEKFEVTVTNTGTTPTKYLDVKFPTATTNGLNLGKATYIGGCRWAAFPLAPAQSTTCDVYRKLTDREVRNGFTESFELTVQPFGATGPQATIFKPSQAVKL